MSAQFNSIAVIDHTLHALFIYDLPENWNPAKIETLLNENGHRLMNCSWGAFDGKIEDQRESKKNE